MIYALFEVLRDRNEVIGGFIYVTPDDSHHPFYTVARSPRRGKNFEENRQNRISLFNTFSSVIFFHVILQAHSPIFLHTNSQNYILEIKVQIDKVSQVAACRHYSQFLVIFRTGTNQSVLSFTLCCHNMFFQLFCNLRKSCNLCCNLVIVEVYINQISEVFVI